MTTKLTLSINSDIIGEAKKFSRKKGISISKLVERYLKQISSADKPGRKYLVDEMLGVIKNTSITPDNWKNLRNEYRDHKFSKRSNG